MASESHQNQKHPCYNRVFLKKRSFSVEQLGFSEKLSLSRGLKAKALLNDKSMKKISMKHFHMIYEESKSNSYWFIDGCWP